MSFILPTLTDGTEAYDERVQLEGVEYSFQFRYNLRRELWSFSIFSLDGTAILAGQSVNCGIPLNRRAVGGPPGVLMAISETENIDAPTLLELGDRVKLCYLTADEVAQIQAEAT